MKRNLEETINWRLSHIREQITRSEDLVNRGFPEFQNDWVLQAAAKNTIETIGEAVASIQDKAGLTGNNMPEPLNKINIPWSILKRFRDKSIHRYYELDYETIIWDTLVKNIPDIKTELNKVCDDNGMLFKETRKPLPDNLPNSLNNRFCGSRNTTNGKPCKNPKGCTIKGH